jgi:hypothetical protein
MRCHSLLKNEYTDDDDDDDDDDGGGGGDIFIMITVGY